MISIKIFCLQLVYHVAFFGKASFQFSKHLKNLIRNKFQVDINVYYTSFKISSYFQLKCATPASLMSNVVYKFTCSYDTNNTYIGMTSQHLRVRVEEHLHAKTNSAIRKHIEYCHSSQ